MSKDLQLHCSRKVCELLADSLRQYADAAYPKGGSECSQSARDSLLLSVDQMLQAWDGDNQSTHISKRLRVPLKSAIKYYCQRLAEEGALSASSREACLLSMLKGEVVDDAVYHAALEQDLSA